MFIAQCNTKNMLNLPATTLNLIFLPVMVQKIAQIYFKKIFVEFLAYT